MMKFDYYKMEILYICIKQEVIRVVRFLCLGFSSSKLNFFLPTIRPSLKPQLQIIFFPRNDSTPYPSLWHRIRWRNKSKYYFCFSVSWSILVSAQLQKRQAASSRVVLTWILVKIWFNRIFFKVTFCVF